MLLQCTKTMQNKLKINDGDLEHHQGHEIDFYAWHVHMITIDRRRIFVLMNNVTRYPVLIYRPSDADMRHPKKLFLTAIKAALLEEGIDLQIVERYIEGKISYAACSGMSLVSKLNALCQDIRNHYCKCFEPNMVCQPRLSVLLSHQPQTYGKVIDMPYKRMLRQLNRVYDLNQTNLINTRTYQLRVSLDLNQTTVMRRFTIPAHFTFHQLHEVIKVLFQWPSAMKYEFQVDEQRLQDGSVIASENGDTHRCLSALIESCKDCVYQNTWRHTIVLEGIIEEGHRSGPYLIEREGIRPPLNVRTEKSYLEYLKIISNPKSKRRRQLMAGNFGDRYEKACSDERLNQLLNKWPQTCRSNHDHH